MSSPLGAFYEFFAGGGMARAGMGEWWRCLFANDYDQKKAATYRLNWGNDNLLCCDVKDVTPRDLAGYADLAWASFPCQDLSLAGSGAGLKGSRSGTFWPFWNLVTKLSEDDRSPVLIVLENVCGTLTSHGGEDFTRICKTLQKGGYRFGVLVVDAAEFVPQSRPRLFVVAVKKTAVIPDSLVGYGPSGKYHPRMLETAYNKLPRDVQEDWIWWMVKAPATRKVGLSDLIEDDPVDVSWHTPTETRRLLSMMTKVHSEKIRKAMLRGCRIVGTGYKRTRRDESGIKAQRVEIRFDDVAGCLRTPAGGSSRQLVIVVEGRAVRSRLLSAREAARLMGLPDDYILPDNYNEAYHLIGDGVVVPVVRFLSQMIFEPILAQMSKKKAAA